MSRTLIAPAHLAAVYEALGRSIPRTARALGRSLSATRRLCRLAGLPPGRQGGRLAKPGGPTESVRHLRRRRTPEQLEAKLFPWARARYATDFAAWRQALAVTSGEVLL